MSAEFYAACVKDKQRSLLSERSCENAMGRHGQPFPCSTLCPCSLRDQYIALYETKQNEPI